MTSWLPKLKSYQKLLGCAVPHFKVHWMLVLEYCLFCLNHADLNLAALSFAAVAPSLAALVAEGGWAAMAAASSNRAKGSDLRD